MRYERDEELSHAALLSIFRLSKARGGRIPAAVCNRRATPERRKSDTTRRARTLWAGWRRCSLLQVTLDMLVCSRLTFQPKAFSRDVAEYGVRPLNLVS